MTPVAVVPIADVVVLERRRLLRDVAALAASIAEIGLLHPITLRDGNRLVAGYHRLEACRSLGWTEIPATVVSADDLRAKLIELDENLRRNEGTQLERSEWLLERKEVYEALHPATKRGGDRGNQHTGGKRRQTATVSFSQDVADKTGKTARSIRQDIQIAERVAPEVKETIRATPLADSKTELIALAQTPPEEQPKIVETILGGYAGSVKAAKRLRKHEQAEAAQAMSEAIFELVGDPEGRIALAQTRADFSDARFVVSQRLLLLDPEAACAALKPEDLLEVRSFLWSCRNWLDRLESELGRGLRLVARKDAS